MTYTVERESGGWMVNGLRRGLRHRIIDDLGMVYTEIYDMREVTRRKIYEDGSIYFQWNGIMHGHQRQTYLGSIEFIITFNKERECGISYVFGCNDISQQ
jgi:hypothetical protein